MLATILATTTWGLVTFLYDSISTGRPTSHVFSGGLLILAAGGATAWVLIARPF